MCIHWMQELPRAGSAPASGRAALRERHKAHNTAASTLGCLLLAAGTLRAAVRAAPGGVHKRPIHIKPLDVGVAREEVPVPALDQLPVQP